MVRLGSGYLNGRDALREVDSRIQHARAALSSALEDVERVESRQVEVRQEQASAYAALASIRLDIVAEGISIDDLQGAEKRAHELLERHEDYVNQKQKNVEDSSNQIQILESERRTAAIALDESVEVYEKKVKEIEAALEADEAYLALISVHEETQAIVARSEQKLALAHEDRIQKGAPYDDDPLFSYLWKRGFRTTAYKSRGFIKMLDGWVARICGFDRARLNYARLTELPERLSEHVDRVKQDETNALQQLEAAEQDALERNNANALQEQARLKRTELGEIDKKIETAEAKHLNLIAEQQAVLSGGKGPAAEARRVLEDALRKASFPDLRTLAAETLERDDDRIVDRLVKLRAEQMSFELDESDLQARPRRLKQDLRGLETLRSEFKRARYDSPYASFKASTLDQALSGLMSGRMDVGKALRLLRRGLREIQPRTPRGFGGQRRSDTLGLPDSVEDILVEVLRQGSRGGWGRSRARQTKRRSPQIKTGSRSRKPRNGKKGGGFKSTGGF